MNSNVKDGQPVDEGHAGSSSPSAEHQLVRGRGPGCVGQDAPVQQDGFVAQLPHSGQVVGGDQQGGSFVAHLPQHANDGAF